MEASEFDVTLGGIEHLPYSANSFKFAAARSIEIAAMTESILHPSKTKLIFQTLPVHMRRRVMSHNSKRLPRKLREGHLEQLKKSGLPPKQKRPSRKYRRRPGNLLDEYNKRQKRNAWLETHIWHAKRFYMIERWRCKLPYAPCDKAFRACYRASSAHCLLQDISYHTPIQITGPSEAIKDVFSNITSKSCELSVSAKAYTTGYREGSAHLYKANSFPFGYIGRITFIWVGDSTLWLFVHPSQTEQVKSVLTDIIISLNSENIGVPEKRRKLTNKLSEELKITILSGIYNRFRLTGPNSHAVLVRSLKCVDDIQKIKTDDWTSLLPSSNSLNLQEKCNYWQNVKCLVSPSQLPPKIVIGLVVKDPRLSRPTYRTKAQPDNDCIVNIESLVKFPPSISLSPMWSTDILDIIKTNRMSNGRFIEHVTKTQLVPGEVYEDDPALQSIPVVLIQRPGSQNPAFKKLGYGSGWDIIIPSGYGLPFWQTFIMFGARSGGLRETESLAFEMGECYLPPDSEAGKEEEKRRKDVLKQKYFRTPPSKRVNHIKLGINSPFICTWKILLNDWSSDSVDDFYVLRDRKMLEKLQDCIIHKKKLPEINKHANCLIALYLQIAGKGNLKNHALICLPQPSDISSTNTIFEPYHNDPNEKLRKLKRSEHKRNVKRWRKKRIKLNKKGTMINTIKSRNIVKNQPSEYVKSMRELWLPSTINTVRYSASRQTLGYISQGAFSFTEAHGCGIGYIAYNALSTLLSSGQNRVLVRNTTSRTYRFATIRIIEST